MKKLTISLLSLTLVSCFGRPLLQKHSVSPGSLGLKQGQAAVVTFSALWCHPCREEIETLNLANKEFGGQVQFVGFLVEGEEKGSPASASDVDGFQSFNGVKPSYPVRLDQGWKLLDLLHPPDGRALPTLIVVDQNGQTLQVVQQSLDYATQLRPLLQSLVAGQGSPPITPPEPPPVPPGLQQLTDTVQNWLQRPEVVANSSLLTNLTASWQAGLLKYTIADTDMPLDDGKMNFSWDGSAQNIPQSATWHEVTVSTVCKMTLILNPDATLISSSGSCKPK